MKQDHPHSTPMLNSRARTSRTKETQRTDSANGASPAGLKSRPTSSDSFRGPTTSTQLLKLRLPADDSKFVAPLRNRVAEQQARLHRRTEADEANSKKQQELQNRLHESEGAVRRLQSEISTLRAQLEKIQGTNVQLESHNRKLQEELFAANAKINILERQHQESSNRAAFQESKFGDVQKLIQLRLQQNKPQQVEGGEACVSTVLPLSSKPPPPPPPPLQRQSAGKVNSGSGDKASSLVELYHSLAKQNGQKQNLSNGILAKNAQNSIVGELQNRSAHLLAIKSDVETKGQLINHLIEKVRSTSFTDVENVVAFVDWLDGELNKLVDETAVLKHFDWPEKKVDALREAAFEYRSLKQLENEVSSFKDDSSLTCEATQKKVSHLFDKLERGMDRLLKLRNGTMVSYKEYKIPTDWMLDSGMVNKIKVASVKLAKVYMRKVSMELKSGRHSERESAQEALLVQGIRFAYRAHQFAGGLDSETMSAFDELKRRMQLARRTN